MKKERITLKAVTVAGRYEFGNYFCGRYVPTYIYKFTDETGKVYVWKTSTYAGIDKKVVDPRDPELVRYEFDGLGKGDIVDIKATIKGESEYKGEPQIILERVKILEKIFRSETPAEKKARIEAENKEIEREQRESLVGGDKIVRMTYKRYKEHYADCETVVGSFIESENKRPAEIEVIIREGREKASGVRGKRIEPHTLITDDGRETVYRATCYENAIKRANKELGGEWKPYYMKKDGGER